MFKPIRQKWKSTMTDRERFNNQMYYKPFDRCFNMEDGFWKDNFRSWSIFVENDVTSENVNEFLGFDRFDCVVEQDWMYPLFTEEVIEETETTKIIRNSEGLLAEVPKDGSSAFPHFIKPSVTTPDDWKSLKRERFRLDEALRKINVGKLKKQHTPERNYPLGIYCCSMIGKVRNLLTLEGLAYACSDYPDMVEDMVETNCQLIENVLDQVLNHIDFDFALTWEDICFKNGPLVTVDFFRQVVVPRYKRVSKKLKDAGINIWIVDCDGDIRKLIPYFLEGGINCLYPVEVNSSGHPSEILDKYSGELRLMGGVDKMKLKEGREAIKEYLETLILLVEKGGYIPFCDHRCPPDVDFSDYLFYLDMKEKLFGMQ